MSGHRRGDGYSSPAEPTAGPLPKVPAGPALPAASRNDAVLSALDVLADRATYYVTGDHDVATFAELLVHKIVKRRVEDAVQHDEDPATAGRAALDYVRTLAAELERHANRHPVNQP